MKLQGEKTGRKGHLSIATEVCLEDYLWWKMIFLWYYHYSLLSFSFSFQIFEVAPSLYMVELRKSGGDTLEFHKVRVKLLCSSDYVKFGISRWWENVRHKRILTLTSIKWMNAYEANPSCGILFWVPACFLLIKWALTLKSIGVTYSSTRTCQLD